MKVGKSWRQFSGLGECGSGMYGGCDSSQSSGFVADGSGMTACSTQLPGFESCGSWMRWGGLTGGSKSVRRLPDLALSPLMKMWNELSGWMESVYSEDVLLCLIGGGWVRWCCVYSPVIGFKWVNIK